MTRTTWVVALLSLVSALVLALPESAIGQVDPIRTSPLEPTQLAQTGIGYCRDCGCPDGLTRTASGCIDCRTTYDAACPAGSPGGFGGGASAAQGAVDAIGALSRGAGSRTGSNVGRGENTRAPDPPPPPDPKQQAQSAVDAIRAIGGGRTAGAETGAPQGWSGERNVVNSTNSGTRTPDQDYKSKMKQFQDSSKFQQSAW